MSEQGSERDSKRATERERVVCSAFCGLLNTENQIQNQNQFQLICSAFALLFVFVFHKYFLFFFWGLIAKDNQSFSTMQIVIS